MIIATSTSLQIPAQAPEMATFLVTLDELMRDVRTIAEQAEELERLGAMIVDNATGPYGRTLAVATTLVDDMSAAIDRIRAHRAATS